MKAVILTAGLGTRFFPITKVVPKALLPIGNKPVAQYIVEEAVASGIDEIIFVTSPEQGVIQKYFTEDPALERELRERNKEDLIEKIHKITSLAKFTFITQEKALGDGHAILQAKELLADEPFAVLFGDDIIDAETPALKQLLTLFEKTNAPVICAERVAKEKISAYGVVDLKSNTQVANLVEKPSPEEAPSDLAIIGKYVCTPEVLTYLEKSQASHTDGEIRLIDGFRAMLEDGKALHALEIQGTRFDVGTPEGLLKAKNALISPQ